MTFHFASAQLVLARSTKRTKRSKSKTTTHKTVCDYCYIRYQVIIIFIIIGHIFVKYDHPISPNQAS